MLELEGYGYINQHLITRIFISEESDHSFSIIICMADGESINYKNFPTKELAEKKLNEIVNRIEFHQVNDWLKTINNNICTIGESILKIESEIETIKKRI